MRFIKEITEIDLQDIIFDSIERFQDIAEYDFYWLKFIGIDEKGLKTNIFLKTIQKGTTRETLFCICNLLCEKYFCKDDDSRKKFKKISILKNKHTLQPDNTVNVNLFVNDLAQEKVKIEIKFIEISKVLEQNKNLMRGWKGLVDVNQDGVLIVGIENNH